MTNWSPLSPQPKTENHAGGGSLDSTVDSRDVLFHATEAQRPCISMVCWALFWWTW